MKEIFSKEKIDDILKDFITNVKKETHCLIPINEEHQKQIFRCLIELTMNQLKSSILQNIDKILKENQQLKKEIENIEKRVLDESSDFQSYINKFRSEIASLKRKILKLKKIEKPEIRPQIIIDSEELERQFILDTTNLRESIQNEQRKKIEDRIKELQSPNVLFTTKKERVSYAIEELKSLIEDDEDG